MTARHWLLDGSSQSPCPEGYYAVFSDSEFLRQACRQEKLYVAGDRLCRWARLVCITRGWQFVELKPPADELRRLCPTLTAAAADAIAKRITQRHVQRPLNLPSICERLWPGGPWADPPSPLCGARWILWLLAHGPTEDEVPVLDAMRLAWLARAAEAPWKNVFCAPSAEPAWAILLDWLRITAPATILPTFPMHILPDTVRRRLRQQIASGLIATQGRLLMDLAYRGSPRAAMEVAAEAAADFWIAHPEGLDDAALEVISSFCREDLLVKVLAARPPRFPGDFPRDFRGLQLWYRDLYLPYRQWAQGAASPEVLKNINGVARAFAEWFLSAYVDARLGGPNSENLVWSKTGGLGRSSEPRRVTALILLDGLGYWDSRRLVHHIIGMNSRLSVVVDTLCLSPVPTVTEFAKPSVLKGVVPAFTSDVGDQVRASDVTDLLSRIAGAGNLDGVVALVLAEPDRTYHRAESGRAGVYVVENMLVRIAALVARLADDCTDDVDLRIVLTTDHGRLLGSADRMLPAPCGLQPHGRAAWSDSPTATHGRMSSPFELVGDIAYLHPRYFGVSSYCVVVLSEAAFLDADGRRGLSRSPHGGLFPEEVLVPWVELVRDADPSLELSLAGTGVASKPGQVILRVRNCGPHRVIVTLLLLGREWPEYRLGKEVAPVSEAEIVVHLPVWPSSNQVRAMTPLVRFRSGPGSYFELEPDNQLKVRDMYSSADILREMTGPHGA